MIAAQFMVILDVSVVNVALPSISDALHLSAADYQWTVSAYVLLSGGLLLLGGRIADLFNRRRRVPRRHRPVHRRLAGQRPGADPADPHRCPAPRRAPAPRCSPRPRCRSS